MGNQNRAKPTPHHPREITGMSRDELGDSTSGSRRRRKHVAEDDEEEDDAVPPSPIKQVSKRPRLNSLSKPSSQSAQKIKTTKPTSNLATPAATQLSQLQSAQILPPLDISDDVTTDGEDKLETEGEERRHSTSSSTSMSSNTLRAATSQETQKVRLITSSQKESQSQGRTSRTSPPIQRTKSTNSTTTLAKGSFNGVGVDTRKSSAVRAKDTKTFGKASSNGVDAGSATMKVSATKTNANASGHTPTNESSPEVSGSSYQIINPKAKKAVVVEEEAAVLARLNVATRIQYLTTFSNRDADIDAPVYLALPGIEDDDPVFAEMRKRVSKQFKSWKAKVTKDAAAWINKWMAAQPGAIAASLVCIRSFRELKYELQESFDTTWLQDVFRFGDGFVDWDRIPKAGIRWLRWAFIQICVHARLTSLHIKDPGDTMLAKYTRAHEICSFDALHNRREFTNVHIGLFPSRIYKAKKRVRIDLNDDSDASVGDDEDDDDVEDTDVVE